MRFSIDSDGWLYRLNPNDGSPALHLRPLPQNATEPRITPISAILHSQAASRQGSFQSAWNWWTSSASAGSEAHAVPNMDGELMQFMSFDKQADCNFRGNGFWYDGKYSGAISFETQDNGSGTLPTTAWTPEQFETIAQVLAALHVHRGLQLVRCPGAYLPGIGYHSQYADWSKYVGKTCPGAARIAQMPALIERAKAIVVGEKPVVVVPPPVVVPPIVVPPILGGGDVEVQELVSCKGAVYAVLGEDGKPPILKVWIINGDAAQHYGWAWREQTGGRTHDGSKALIREITDLPTMHALGPVINAGTPAGPGRGTLIDEGWDSFGWK